MAKTQRRSNRIPKHRRHATGQGIVTLSGKDHYTGKFGTPKSEQRYKDLVSDWIANDRKPLPIKKRSDQETSLGISVAELRVRFLSWARATYRDDKGDREEYRTLERSSLLLLPDEFALIPAADFSRRHFHEIRDGLIQRRKARGTINNRMTRIKKIFTWAADRELIPFEAAARIKSIPNLKAGEQGVRERPAIKPVDQETVEKTLSFLTPNIQSFVRLLRLTGARCGELSQLRPCDIHPTEDAEVLVFRPHRHKTEHHRHSREIYIGPQAREILTPLLAGVPSEGYVFQTARTKRPLRPNDVASALRAAFLRAARSEVELKPWHVHQLRHARLTEERREGSIDSAQLLGGHSTATMTQRYASPDASKAIEAAKKRG
jgi:integrase